MSSLTRTMKRSISHSGQTGEERYRIALSAVAYRLKYHGEHLATPNRKDFRNLNKYGAKRERKMMMRKFLAAERAKSEKEKAKTTASTAKPGILNRIKSAFTRKAVKK